MYGQSRAERWYRRNAKYRRKLYRRRQEQPYCWGRGEWFETQGHGVKPVAFVGDGSTQQPLWQLIKNPKNGGFRSLSIVAPKISEVGYKKPPHVSYPPPFHGPTNHHATRPEWFWHNRPVMYAGKKIGRLNGKDRLISLAGMLSFKHMKVAGYRAYPDWDPLARTPVTGETFGSLGRVYGPPCA